jgi:hypothetical protein
VNDAALGRRRSRTHAIVEGALLGDISIVFLLMRAYLPILFVRPLFAAVATVPIVLLLQRRGAKMTILAGIASYILFSALVGPLLGIAVINVLVAGCLIGLGRRLGFGAVLNTLLMGPIFAVLDIIVPTLISIFVFRLPTKQLIKSAQNGVSIIFRFVRFLVGEHGPVPSLGSIVHGLTHRPQFIVLVVIAVALLVIPQDRKDGATAADRLASARQSLVDGWRNALATLAGVVIFLVVVVLVAGAHAPASWFSSLHTWQHWSVEHWQVPLVIIFIFQGCLLLYLGALVSEMVLKRLPHEVVTRQETA